MTPAPKIEAAVHGPYEDLAIALVGLFVKLIDGQPPAVREKLGQWFIEDMQAWRDFWHNVAAPPDVKPKV